jgi:hypothetical protein
MRGVMIGLLISLADLRLHASEVRFGGPYVIRGVASPVSVVAADLSGGGKLDLVTANGSRTLHVLRQNASERTEWEMSSIDAGFGIYMVRAVDLDGNGQDEILAADPGTTVYLIRNDRGNLGAPEPLDRARQPRWITAGDWDADGYVDMASASFDRGTVSIFKGFGLEGLRLRRDVVVDEPHAVEGTDYDGDGDLDIIVGHGDHGFRHLQGNGDGTFMLGDPATGLPECGRYLFTGDFNVDGKGDIVLTCQYASVQGDIPRAVMGTSNGDGSYTESMNLATEGIASVAVADLTDDGIQDISMVTAGSRILSVFPGKGDGSFLPEVLFGPTGNSPPLSLRETWMETGSRTSYRAIQVPPLSRYSGDKKESVSWRAGTSSQGARLVPRPLPTSIPTGLLISSSLARALPGWMFTSRQASRPHPCRPSVSPWLSPVTI